MGKIAICSKSADMDRLASNITGFDVNNDLCGDYGRIVTYRKLRVETVNYAGSGDDYAVGVGTFIYKGEKDQAALSSILSDFSGDISIRGSIAGSYCIAIYKAGKMTIFVDGSAAYSLYYYFCEADGCLIATNTYYHVASCLPEPTVNVNGLIGEWMLNSIAETTMFDDVTRLTGDRALVFDGERWSIVEIALPHEPSGTDVCQLIKSMYAGFPKLFKSCGVFQTGGQDSRLSLAAMCSFGLKPTLYYGEGNSTSLATKSEDKETVKKIAQKLDLPFCIMDWSDLEPDNIDEKIKMYGEYYDIYDANAHFYRAFEKDIDCEFVTFGYLGEVFRSVETIDDYKKDEFTLEEYVDDLIINPKLKKIIPDYAAYRSFVLKQYESVCRSKHIDPKKLTRNDFQKLNTPYRLRWDTQLNSFSNQFFYSMPIVGDIRITDCVERVDYKEKTNAKYQMRCIGSLCPELLTIPFFSHIKKKTFNADTYELTDTQAASRIKDEIRRHIKSKYMLELARKMYYIIIRDLKGLREISEEYKKIGQVCDETVNSRLYRQVGFLKTDLTVFNDIAVLNYFLSLERLITSCGGKVKQRVSR